MIDPQKFDSLISDSRSAPNFGKDCIKNSHCAMTSLNNDETAHDDDDDVDDDDSTA